MTTFGRQVLTNTGNGLQVTSDGAPEWDTGGSTIDWSTINPVTVATLLAIEGITVPAGSGYLRYGQIMCRIRGTQTFTAAVTATDGLWNLSVTVSGNTQTATGLEEDITAANLQTAIRALSNVDAATTVTLLGTTYTINFPSNMGTVSLSSTQDATFLLTGTVTLSTLGSVYTLTNTSTAGTATITVTVNGVAQTTASLAWNITAAALQTALRLLSNCAGVVVGNGGADFGSGTGVYTIMFPASTGAATLVANGAGLTAANTWVVALIGVGSNGKYGPYDPNAADGRQLLTRGDCGILNQTILQNGAITGLGTSEASDHPGLIVGGRLWRARILMTTGSASLAAGPTVSAFETAFPRVSYSRMF